MKITEAVHDSPSGCASPPHPPAPSSSTLPPATPVTNNYNDPTTVVLNMALISILEGPTIRDFIDHELAGLADHPRMRFSIPHIKEQTSGSGTATGTFAPDWSGFHYVNLEQPYPHMSPHGYMASSPQAHERDVVVNCAALSIPCACETDPSHAMSVNVPSSLVKWLSSFTKINSFLIHLSTDQAFVVEGQVKEKSKWLASLRDMARKLKHDLMAMEQSFLEANKIQEDVAQSLHKMPEMTKNYKVQIKDAQKCCSLS
ncbi:NAD(P)-binding Rossmann-fold superfamily protein [Tanacetum coccineum]